MLLTFVVSRLSNTSGDEYIIIVIEPEVFELLKFTYLIKFGRTFPAVFYVDKTLTLHYTSTTICSISTEEGPWTETSRSKSFMKYYEKVQ